MTEVPDPDPGPRICKQCTPEKQVERRVLLVQESPNGTAWYLCIRCWVDWDRDERGSRTVGVDVPPPPTPVALPPAGRDADRKAKPSRNTTRQRRP